MGVPIERRLGAKDGRPLVEGTKIGVYQIYALVDEEGLGVEEVVGAYRELSRDDVEEALAYAADHPEEMGEISRQDDRAFEEGMERGTVVLVDENEPVVSSDDE